MLQTITPFIDLNQIVPDPALIQLMPLGLAIFYEALPVAREDGQVTVVMSHPENTTALAVLARVLQGAIVPVRSSATTIRAAIHHAYPAGHINDHNILAWLAEPDCVAPWLDALGQQLQAQIIEVDATEVDVDTLTAAARSGGYLLTACEWHPTLPLASLLSDLTTPLLLLRRVPHLHGRVLVVLRGFASDELAIHWVSQLTPLVETVVLLPLLGRTPWGGLAFLDEADPVHAHVSRCVAQLEASQIVPRITLHPGEPVEQILRALRQDDYDFTVITAEGHGQFVHQVLCLLDPLISSSILVLKPVA